MHNQDIVPLKASKEKSLMITEAGFFMGQMPSCCPTNNLKALKE